MDGERAGAANDRPLFEKVCGADVLVLAGGGFRVLRNGHPAGTWAGGDFAAALRAYLGIAERRTRAGGGP